MAQVSADSSVPEASSTALAKPRPQFKPMSPHLEVWRWHVTMAASILHRASGIALYVGAVIVTAWVAALAAGPDAYAKFVWAAGSPIGLLVWFGLTLAAFYHLAAGLRHLVWDTGAGLTPKTASTMAAASIVFGVVATLAFWIFLFASGAVVL